MIKVKCVGQWKIGDVVFKDDPQRGYVSSPTPAGYVIVKFSQDKQNVTLRCLPNPYSIVTCPVSRLREYGGWPHGD